MRVRPILVPLALLHGCADPGPPTDTAPGAATVVRVVDGDTLVVDIGGHDETVRLVGIDTPETHRPNTPVECFGPEAAAHLAELLPDGTAVRLERDVEPRDQYGRLLAYVYRRSDGVLVNEAMARDGYAAALTIPPNVAREAVIAAAVVEARNGDRGLWAACGGPHEEIRG
ncbi:MAG: thermonuclease family protein [Chloroflexi bacterium]|nr:thermonuclease family protein [Chloroflexota bacterium]